VVLGVPVLEMGRSPSGHFGVWAVPARRGADGVRGHSEGVDGVCDTSAPVVD
jgi:hypothetical protein